MSKKKILLVLVILSMLISSCAVAPSGSPSPTVNGNNNAPQQPAPADQPVQGTKSNTATPEVTIQPQPVPVPPPSNVELYGFIAQAWGSYAVSHGIKTYEQALAEADNFGAMKLQIGDKLYPIKETIQSFTQEDWKQIHAVGEYISQQVVAENGGGEDTQQDPNDGDIHLDTEAASIATIFVGRCRTTCLEVFEELWYACAHLATGANWIRIDEGYMSNHPDPVLCNHKVNWERLVELLEDCPGYSVSYAGSSILIRKLKKSQTDRYDFSLNNADVATISLVVAGVATTAAIVGIVVIASGGTAAPVLALVLLVP